MGFPFKFPAIVLGIVIACVLMGCQSRSSAPVDVPQNKLTFLPDQKMERMRIQSYSSKGLDWALSAPLAEGYSSEGKTQIKDLKVDLYENSTKSTEVTANEGLIFNGHAGSDLTLSSYSVVMQPGDIFLEGNVVMISTEGNKIVTDWAHYQKVDDIIVSRAPVTVNRPDSITRGTGLKATADLKKIEIFNQTLTIPGRPRGNKN